MPEETEVTPAVTTEPPAQPEPFEERGLKFVEAQLAGGAATDSATTNTETTEAATTAAATTATTDKVETKTEEQKAADDQPFTTEEIADPKFWDRLDKAGWAKAERVHPVETARVKAAYRAASLKVAEATREPVKPAAEARTDAPAKPKISDAMKAAARKANSLDEDEALEGQLELQRLIAEERDQERAAKSNAAKEEAKDVLANASEVATAEFPELASIPDAELDAEVESNPKFMKRINAAITHPDKEQRVLLLAGVMEDAGRSVVAKRQAAAKADEEKKVAEKKAADQARLRSNEKDPSRVLVETQQGTKPAGKKTLDTHGLDFINSQLANSTRT